MKITFAIHTGLRSHELCGLDVGHVMTWDGFPRQWVVGKVPLNPIARQAVVDLVHFKCYFCPKRPKGKSFSSAGLIRRR